MTVLRERKDQIAATLRERLGPLLEQEGGVLVAVRVSRAGRGFRVECLIDRTEGGITIGECARFHRMFAGLLEEENLIPEDFSLEVASPGMDWPLTTVQDFRRVTGQKVVFNLEGPLEGQQHFTGVIEEVGEETVAAGLEDGRKLSIPISFIKKAMQKI